MPGAGSKWTLWVEKERGFNKNEEPPAQAKVTPKCVPHPCRPPLASLAFLLHWARRAAALLRRL